MANSPRASFCSFALPHCFNHLAGEVSHYFFIAGANVCIAWPLGCSYFFEPSVKCSARPCRAGVDQKVNFVGDVVKHLEANGTCLKGKILAEAGLG